MSDLPEIPGFEIVSQLSEGGMSTVYLGIQKRLKRKIVIKILNPALSKKKKIEELFINEAQIAANLQHSNIIQIFDAGKVDGYYYTIMEYLEDSLKDRMQQYPEGMPPKEALTIIKKIMSALDYSHWQGVFHRDIKPNNIMFRKDSTPVLIDFGISLLFAIRDESGVADEEEEKIMGTIHYMSPEQCLNKKDIDGRSDIYSLGVVLYEMLTGKRPYEGDTQLSIAVKHAKEPVPVLPEEIGQYQSLIDSMMSKKRRKRISSGAQFMEMLEKIECTPAGSAAAQGEPCTDQPPQTVKQRPKYFIKKSIKKLKSFLKKTGRKNR